MARKKKDTDSAPAKKEDKLLGQCLYCHEAVMESHDHGYVKQKGVSGKKYFHTRCMEPTIGESRKPDSPPIPGRTVRTPRYDPPPMPAVKPPRGSGYYERTESGLLTED